MQTLSVLAVEDGAIVVAAPTGERFRLPLDASLRARLAAPAPAADERRLSPREIQAHVRSGLTADQVAAMTGAPVAYIERFTGPVLAELAYVVESGLAVRLPPETDGARSRTFGAVMGERLEALAAHGVSWTSAKEPSGWVLAVAFTADSVRHDARWRFDPKHMRLEPDNVEASTMSQQGVPAALTPRLRAIEPTAPVTVVPPRAFLPEPEAAPTPDRSRFDSAAFSLPPLEEGRPPAASATEPPVDTGSLPVTRAIEVVDDPRAGQVFAPRPAPLDRPTAPVTPFRPRSEPGVEAPRRSAAGSRSAAPEPLRRRRERGRTEEQTPRAAPENLAPRSPAASPPAGRAPQDPAAPDPAGADQEERGAARPRRGRTSMPSWDEIVFGRDD